MESDKGYFDCILHNNQILFFKEDTYTKLSKDGNCAIWKGSELIGPFQYNNTMRSMEYIVKI